MQVRPIPADHRSADESAVRAHPAACQNRSSWRAARGFRSQRRRQGQAPCLRLRQFGRLIKVTVLLSARRCRYLLKNSSLWFSMPDAIELLKPRRSMKPREMSGPGPSPAELDTILTIGARVPDHGKLAPWRFIVFEGDARQRAGEIIAGVFA